MLTENWEQSEESNEHGDWNKNQDKGVELFIIRFLHDWLGSHGVVVVVEVSSGDWLRLVGLLDRGSLKNMIIE